MIKNNNNSISSVYDETTCIGKIMKGIVKVYESFKNLLASGIPPLTLTKCKGEDLVDYKVYGESIQNGYAISLGSETENKNINANGEEVDNTNFKIIEYMEVLPNANYIFKGTQNLTVSNNKRVSLYNENYEWIGIAVTQNIPNPSNYSINFTTTSDTKYIKIATLKRDTDISVVCLTPTPEAPIEVESVGDKSKNLIPYEPYGYKIPVVTKGNDFDIKNKITTSTTYFNSNFVIDNEDWITLDIKTTSTSTSTSFYNFWTKPNMNLLNNKTYSLILEVKEIEYSNIATTNGITLISDHDESNSYSQFKTTSSGTSKYFSAMQPNSKYKFLLTTKEDFSVSTTMLRSYITRRANGNVKIKFRISVIEGDIDLDKFVYSKYTEPVTTNIYLDEPLRKIGDYADYIDFENGKVVRKTKKVDMSTLKYSGGGSNGQLWYSNISDLAIGTEALSSTYSYITVAPNSLKDGQFCTVSSSPRVYFHKGESTDIPKGILEYILATPIEETIELPKIPTFKGTTILSVDTEIQPSNIEVIYKGK